MPSESINDLISGTPWGAVGNPPRPNPPPGAVDGRTACLRVLRRFLAELTFRRPGDKDPVTGRLGAPIEFQIPAEDILIGWPDNVEDLRFPSIVMLSGGLATYDALGFTPYIEESSEGIYGPGTVLHGMAEVKEILVLDVWASKKPELRALLAGLEVIFMPSQDMAVLRFRVPDYFDELVAFTLEGREWFEEPDAALNRRHFRLTLDMRFNVVRLVTTGPITVEAIVAVDANPLTGGDLTLDPNRPSDERELLAEIRGIPAGTLPVDPCDPFHPGDC
jgi:hypothetical protein